MLYDDVMLVRKMLIKQIALFFVVVDLFLL